MQLEDEFVSVLVSDDVNICRVVRYMVSWRREPRDEIDVPDSFPTPIWFPTEWTESRLDIARIAR